MPQEQILLDHQVGTSNALPQLILGQETFKPLHPALIIGNLALQHRPLVLQRGDLLLQCRDLAITFGNALPRRSLAHFGAFGLEHLGVEAAADGRPERG